jgi:hypothetical protein
MTDTAAWIAASRGAQGLPPALTSQETARILAAIGVPGPERVEELARALDTRGELSA